MYWHIRKTHYDILIPKLDKHIYELNEAEAAEYFSWYRDVAPERIAYLSQVCAKDLGVSDEKMDCSPESLLILWKWFRKRAKWEIVKTTQEEKFPHKPQISKQLTLETEYILRDIGMYLGETFTKNNTHIYWSYYTNKKRDFFLNHPLLKGFIDRTFGEPFEACFEPIHMARIQALKVIDRTSKDVDLLNLYNLWSKKSIESTHSKLVLYVNATLRTQFPPYG